jgi:membrane-bound lytic murein transglycosylase D
MPAFIEAGIPLWLMNIAMVESQFNPKARSSAGPAGMWQLQAETARGLGLTVNSKVDERMDPEKSTQAVVKLLQSSYKTLNSWELTLAAYSAGTYRVKKAVEASPGSNLTALARKGLISGTCMNNVAMVLAAARIAESPEDHGFQPVSMNIDFGSLNSETRLLMEQLDQR